MEQSIAQHYGSLLDTVTVSDTTNTVAMGGPYAAGTYRLKGLRLVFAFEVLFGRGRWSAEIFGGAEGVRAVTHSDIGGMQRFFKLAQQYHLDFPAQKSMSYWRTDDNQVNASEPYRSILRGHPGLSVIVYDHDDFWGAAPSSVQLGIYWWDKANSKWVLIHRGDLPDNR
jgi:hypothetical protein